MEEHRRSMTKDDMCHLPCLDEAPWLILTDESEFENQITFCSMNNKSYTKTIDELHGKFILACNQGWVFLQERVNRSRYSLWNPVTRQCLSLPELLDSPEEEQKQRPICMFTSPPDGNASCVVLLLFNGVVFSCRLTMRDDCKWVKQSLEHDGRGVHIIAAAALNGDIYVRALVKNSHSRGFSNTFGRIKVTDSDSDSDSDSSSNRVLFEPMEIQYQCESININTYPRRTDYLVEVCGVLYNVHTLIRQSYEIDDYDIVKAYVSRLDLPQMKWIQVESLGDRAFLLGTSCCTWCWADSSCPGIEGNCIYKTHPWSKIVHQYRLQDDSYIFLNPYLNVLQIFDNPIWFMPRNFTWLSSDRLRKSEDTKNIEHIEELDEMKMHGLTSSLFCQLPSDMLRLVTAYLHLFDYMNLRTTCKILRSTIPRPQWRSNCSYPLFMSLKNTKAGVCELWDPCQNICQTVRIPHSADMLSTIEFCKDGWLLLRIEGNSLQCFNPFKGKSYKYPSYDKIATFSGLAFSTCPTSPDCLTVGIYANNWVRIHYFQAEDDEWEYDEIDFDSETGIEFVSNENSSPKYHDGAFYFLGVNVNLGVLRMVDEEDDGWSWSWNVHKGPIPDDILLNSCQLVELDDQLIAVLVEEEGKALRVFKFDSLGNDWVALDDLGDYMLFVSPASSFSISTNDNSMKNRVYLPKRIGNEMVFYSLTTGMYQTSSSQHPSKDFYGMRSQSFSCWL